MKKILLILLTLSLFSGCTTKQKAIINPLEGEIVMAVENEKFGEDFLALWQETYPEYPNALKFVVYDDFDSVEFQENYSDLAILWDVDAAGMQDLLLPIDISQYRLQLVSQYLLNTQEVKYLPLAGLGSFFIVNKTLLSENGIDTSDNNHDGLIDAVDSFEKIANLDFEVKMHYDVDDEYSANFLFTNGFKLFADNDKSNPGFTSEAFINALQTSLDLKSLLTLSDFVYPDDLADGSVPFIIGLPTFLIAEEAEALGVEYQISKFPTYQNQEFYPFASSKGYVINADCDYPDLANLVLALLETPEGLQLYLNDTMSYLLYDGDADLEYQDWLHAEISQAYQYSYPSDFYGYGNDNSQNVEDMLAAIAYQATLKDVFNEKITVSEATTSLDKQAKEWLVNVTE